MATIGNILVRIGLVDDVSSNLNKTARNIRNFGRDMEAAGRAVAPLGLGILAAGVAAVKAAGDYDALRRGLDTVTGSAAETQRQMAQLREIAKAPGIGFEEALRGSINLQTVGFNAQRAQRILVEFANALASVGRGREDLDEVIRQLGQLSNRSKVTADNLRPIIERVPQAAAIIKKEFGTIDTEQLQKLGISSEVFIEKLVGGLAKGARATGGIKNEIDNFLTDFKLSLAEAGEAIVPFATVVLRKFGEVVTGINSTAKEFKKLPESVRDAVVEITAILALTPVAVGIGGRLISGWADLIKFIRGPVLTAIVAFGGFLGTALTGLTAQFAGLGVAATAFAGALAGSAIIAVSLAITKLVEAILALKEANRTAEEQQRQFQGSLSRTEKSLQSQGGDITDLQRRYREGKIGLEEYMRGLRDVAVELGKAKKAAEQVKPVLSLQDALKFVGGDKDLSFDALKGQLDKAKEALRVILANRAQGIKVAAGAIEEAQKKLKEAQEAFGGKTEDPDKAFGALGLRNLEKEVADAVKALASLEKAGKLTGDRLDDAAGHVERLKRALRLANETGSTEPAKFVDPRSVDEIERVNEAFAKVKEERKKARDAADNYNQTLHEMSLLEAGVTDGISNETILLADLQRTVQGLNPEFNALVLRMEETSNQWKKLGEGFQLGMPDMGGLQKTMQVYADLKALGIKSEADLAKTIAQARNVAESQQADIGLGTRLAARVKQYDAELQLLKEALRDQTEEERKATGDQIKVKEKLLTSTQKQLDKITGAHRRATGILKGFWQTMSNQVSTILTDLSRQIVDVLFPREKTDSRDVAAITELGLRAGVSGKQLEDLTKVVQDLATATGTDFRSAATGAADVFRAFGVGVADQIPLLRQLFAVSQVTGTALSELFSGVAGNADLFKALGFSAGQAAVLVGQLSKAGYDTSKIMGALNSALKTLREKGFVNPGAALQDLIRRIREAGTESEATSLAVRYFGDNAQELVRIIRSGKLDLAAINAEIDKTSESLEKAAEKTKELAKEQSALGKIMSEVWRSVVRAAIEAGIAALIKFIAHSKALKALWEDIKGVFIAIGKAIGIINRESEKTKVPGTGTTPGKTGNSTDPVGSSKNPNHVVLDSPVPLPVEVQNFPVGEGVKPTHVIIDGPIPLPVVGMVVSTPMPTLPGVGNKAFPGGGGGGGGATGAMGAINMVTGAISAGAGVVSAVNSFRQDGTLNAIEHNTRYTMIYTGGQADSILETLHVIRNRFLDFTGGAGGNGYGFGTLIDLTAQMNDRLMAILERIGSFASVPIPQLAAAGASDTVVSGGGDTYYNTFNIEASDPKRTAEEVSRHLTNRGIRHRTRIR